MKKLVLKFECDQGTACFATGFTDDLIEAEKRIKAGEEETDTLSGLERIQNAADWDDGVVISMGMNHSYAQITATLDGEEIDPNYMQDDPDMSDEDFEDQEGISRRDCLVFDAENHPDRTVFFEIDEKWDHIIMEQVDTDSSEAELTLDVDDDFRLGDLTLILKCLEPHELKGASAAVINKMMWVGELENEIYAVEYKGKRYEIGAEYSGGGQNTNIISRVNGEWDIDEELEELFEDEW